MTALAIGIHNVPEGLATFMATLASIKSGGAMAVAIAIHNIPEASKSSNLKAECLCQCCTVVKPRRSSQAFNGSALKNMLPDVVLDVRVELNCAIIGKYHAKRAHLLWYEVCIPVRPL
eukprot:1140254-Pelagomonas_calceolata.AAC.2